MITTQCLQVRNAKVGDKVRCEQGGGTGFLRRGLEYVLTEITATGYVRVEGSRDYYHPVRFSSAQAARDAFNFPTTKGQS